MKEWKIWWYFVQLARAVAFLNNQKIIHTDIKSDNMMIDKKNKILKLLDFGVSRLFDDMEQTEIQTNKVHMKLRSPEMLREGKQS